MWAYSHTKLRHIVWAFARWLLRKQHFCGCVWSHFQHCYIHFCCHISFKFHNFKLWSQQCCNHGKFVYIKHIFASCDCKFGGFDSKLCFLCAFGGTFHFSNNRLSSLGCWIDIWRRGWSCDFVGKKQKKTSSKFGNFAFAICDWCGKWVVVDFVYKIKKCKIFAFFLLTNSAV